MSNRNKYGLNSQRYAPKCAINQQGALLIEILIGLSLMTTLALGIMHFRWKIKETQYEAFRRLQTIQELDSELESHLSKTESGRRHNCSYDTRVVSFYLPSGELFCEQQGVVITARKEYASTHGPRRLELKTFMPEGGV